MKDTPLFSFYMAAGVSVLTTMLYCLNLWSSGRSERFLKAFFFPRERGGQNLAAA